MPRTIAAPELLTSYAAGNCSASCVLADVALADVALQAWYMRLQ